MFHNKNVQLIFILIFISFHLSASPKPLLPASFIAFYDSTRSKINQQDHFGAFDYLNKIKYSEEVKNSLTLQAAAEYLEGAIYRDLQFYDKSEYHYLISLDLFKKTNQKEMVCLNNYILGAVVEASKMNPEKQYKYFKESLDLAIELKDTIRIVTGFDAVGCSLSKLKEYDKAIENSKMAEKIMKQTTLNIKDPNVYVNIAEFYYKKGDYYNARVYIEMALQMYGKRDDTSYINDAFRIAGMIYIKLENDRDGWRYLNKALNYCRKDINEPLLSQQTYDFIINEYSKRENYKEAFLLKNEYAMLKDSASQKEQITRLTQNQVLIEASNRDKEREILINSLASEQKQNKFVLSMTILLASLLVALFFLYWEKKGFNKKLKIEVANQTETLVLKNTELERFAFIASHDLRTPLRNIISFSGLLDRKLRGNPDKDTKEYIGFIKDYAHHMNNIIDDILHFSKIGKSEKEEIEPVNLNDVVDNVLKSLKDKTQERNAIIRTEGVLPTVMADKTHVVQLMQNILENALTYNESEHPEIKIGIQNDENGVPTIYVQDNGIGVDDQYQAKVFEMFTRLHNIEKYPGTGLGLAICKKIVMQYGGRIWLNSALGKGTTVHIALPVAA